ncbi:NAD-dependent epimerase/dehydratase family protein [Elusimicrobiota bacterium]
MEKIGLKNQKRVLITGADGFIGQALYKRMIKSKQWKCFLCTEHKLANVRCPAFKCDLRDPGQTERLINKIDPRYIVHLAAVTPQASMDTRSLMLSNIKMTSNILSSVHNMPIKRIVHVGTVQEYSKSGYSETCKSSPNNAYTASKVRSMDMIAKSGVPFVHLRFSVVYGPGQNRNFFIPSMFHAAANEMELKTTDGFQKRDFIYIDDAVRAILLALSSQKLSGAEIINIALGRSHTLRQTAGIFARATGKQADIKWGAKQYQKNETFKLKIPVSKAKRMLGFSPKVNLEQGLRKMNRSS